MFEKVTKMIYPTAHSQHVNAEIHIVANILQFQKITLLEFIKFDVPINLSELLAFLSKKIALVVVFHLNRIRHTILQQGISHDLSVCSRMKKDSRKRNIQPSISSQTDSLVLLLSLSVI